MHMHAMNSPDSRLRGWMACIGDASRFQLVRILQGGERCVTDLASEVGLSQSCTTRHLQALQRRRIVCGERDGKRVVYRLCQDEPALAPLLEWALGAGLRESGPNAESGGPARRPRPRPASSQGNPSEKAEPPPATSPSPPPREPRRADLEDYLL
jgi:DNA-binding transcriptional ArsR family regulator